MRREKTSVSQEDYLKSIWEMLEEAQTPISARLAEELHVTPPAVTAALKRMTRDGHVRVERTGRIDLTRKGRAVAGAPRAAPPACRNAAHRSDRPFLGQSARRSRAHGARHFSGSGSAAAQALRQQKSCPHGVPMRGGIAKLREHGAVLLAELRPNDSAEIVCVYEKDRQFLEFLEGLHLRPSTKVDVVKREYDETMTLRANGKKLHLGKPATTRIWVRRLSA